MATRDQATTADPAIETYKACFKKNRDIITSYLSSPPRGDQTSQATREYQSAWRAAGDRETPPAHYSHKLFRSSSQLKAVKSITPVRGLGKKRYNIQLNKLQVGIRKTARHIFKEQDAD